MKKSDQNFLTINQKKWAIAFAFVFSIIISITLNSNFLQANMKGEWAIKDNSIQYGFKSIPKEVSISPSNIKIGDTINIQISYGSKSNSPSITRKNFDKGDIIYSFYDKKNSSNIYMLIYNRKNPDEMILMMKKAEDVNGDELNLFTLQRKEND